MARWTFSCRSHAVGHGGEWDGMVGHGHRRGRAAGETPSGVDFSENRVKTGAVQGDWVQMMNTAGARPFASEVTVGAQGEHTVELRSTDEAGNVEATKRSRSASTSRTRASRSSRRFVDPASGMVPLLPRFIRPQASIPTVARSPTSGSPRTAPPSGARSRGSTPRPGSNTAKATATDDEGDTTSKTVTVTATAAGRAAADRRKLGSDVTGGPAALSVKFTAHGQRPRRAKRTTSSTPGTSRRPRARSSRTRSTRTSHEGHLHRQGDGQRRQRRYGVQDGGHHRHRQPRATAAPTITGIGKVSPHTGTPDAAAVHRAERAIPRDEQAHVHVGLRRPLATATGSRP